MSAALLVLLAGRLAGRVERGGRGRGLAFVYDGQYAAQPRAVPLSLSMPTRQRRFEDGRVEGWMSSLLPGHPDVRSHWAARHGAASAHPFDLLGTRVGRECAGAVQFCWPEEFDDVAAGRGGTHWMTEAETDEMVAGMVRQSTLWGRQLSHSAFSLAGAHAKVALYRDEARPRRWAETSGDSPTTHILKPPVPGDPGQSINEHLCMTAARGAGLAAAETELQSWAGHTVLVARRFDRVRTPGGGVRRIHLEDLYQAAGDYTASIYQGDHHEGHGPATVSGLLAAHSSDPVRDRAAFFDALALNWLICNTDAHSKNYSLLLGPAEVRLAPLYDVWSIMVSDPEHHRSHTLAMSALTDRRILAADNRQAWESTAAAVGLDPSEGVDRVERLVGALPAALGRAIDELDDSHRSAATVPALAASLQERAASCMAALARRGPDGARITPTGSKAPGAHRPARSGPQKRSMGSDRPKTVCGAWMPRARAFCVLDRGHRGPHRSKRS